MGIMYCRTFLAFALVVPYHTSAWRVSILPVSAIEDRQETGEIARDVAALGLSSKEVQEVFGDLTNLRSMHSTDCHSAIASRLRTSCGKGGNMNEPEEAEKSEIAISFTLCSMLSALQPLPTECLPWSPSTPMELKAKELVRGRSSKTHGLSEIEQRAKCLGALHRSPQDWSSYNGYLSDATLLCFALRGKWQADMSHRTYLNATMEKLALVQLLNRNEASRRLHDERLRLNLWDKLQRMQSTSEVANTALRGLSRHGEEQTAILSKIRAAVIGLENDTVAMWERVEVEGKQRAMESLKELEGGLLGDRGRWATELSMSLNNVVEHHSNSLRARQDSFDSFMDYLMIATRNEVLSISDLSSGRMAEMSRQWESLLLQSNLVRATLEGVANTTVALNPLLELSVDSALYINNLNSETAVSMEAAAHQSRFIMDELSRSSDFITESLNTTLCAISEWQRSLTQSENWWRSSSPFALFPAPSFIPPDWVTNFAKDNHLAILFRGLGWVGGVLFKIVFFGVYGLISVLASLWLLLRTRLWRFMSSLTRGIWRDVRSIMDGLPDEERAVSTYHPLSSPAYASPADSKESKALYPRGLLKSGQIHLGQGQLPTLENKSKLRKSYGSLRRTDWVEVRRRAASEPP